MEEEEGVGSQVVYFLQKEYLLLEGYLELHIRHLHPAGYKSIFYKKKKEKTGNFFFLKMFILLKLYNISLHLFNLIMYNFNVSKLRLRSINHSLTYQNLTLKQL